MAKTKAGVKLTINIAGDSPYFGLVREGDEITRFCPAYNDGRELTDDEKREWAESSPFLVLGEPGEASKPAPSEAAAEAPKAAAPPPDEP